MSKNFKLAIVGPMRSGKDTVADELEKSLQHHGWFDRFAFADPIKEITRTYFPETENQEKPRHHYILIGELFRSLDPDVWVKNLITRIRRGSWDKPDNIIVTDLRRRNEYDALKAEGFTIIKVTADDKVRKERILSKGETFKPEEFYHATETGIKTIPHDYLIENNGTYDELMAEIHLLTYELLNGGSIKQ